MSYRLMVCFFAFILLSLLTLPVSAQSVKSTRGQKPTAKTSQTQRSNRQNTVKHLDKLDFATTYQIWTDWYRAQEQGIKLPVPTININVNDEREYNRLVAIWKQGQVKAEEDFRLRLAQAAKAKEAVQLSDGGEEAADLTDQPPQSPVASVNSITTVVNPIQSPLPGFNRPRGIAGVLAATTSPMVKPNPISVQPSPVNAVLANNNGILDDLKKKEIKENIAKAKSIADAANPMALSGANVSTKYLVDTNNVTGLPQVIEESQYVNGVLATVKQYTYGADGLISQRQLINGQWVTSFFVKDGQGSIRMLTDVNGNVTDTYDYDAFGNLVNITGNTPNNRLYAGEELDLDLGFYYLRDRYLNQATGRFFTQDSFEGIKENPLSLHKYSYAHNNPVNKADPTGKFAVDIAIASTIAGIFSTVPVQQPGTATSNPGGLKDINIRFVNQTGRNNYDILTQHALYSIQKPRCKELFKAANQTYGTVFLSLEKFSQTRNQGRKFAALTTQSFKEVGSEPLFGRIAINSESESIITTSIFIHELLHVTNVIGGHGLAGNTINGVHLQFSLDVTNHVKYECGVE